MGKPVGIQCFTHTCTCGGFYLWPHGYSLQNKPFFIQNHQVLDEQRLVLKLAGRRISTHTNTHTGFGNPCHSLVLQSTLGYPISGPIRLNNFSLRINLIACFRVGSQVFGPFLWQMVLVHMMAQMAQMVHWALGHCMVQGHLYFGPDHLTLSHSVWGLKNYFRPKSSQKLAAVSYINTNVLF